MAAICASGRMAFFIWDSAMLMGLPVKFTKVRIFEPLGMKDSSWRDDWTRVVKRRAMAYAERGGRVVIDGCARLLAPDPAAGDLPAACEWDRIRRVDDRTLVVYWSGGAYFPLDHVSTEWKRRTLVLTVWIYGGGGPAAGAVQ